MYLSKLEIFGFKSFANKTTIKFTRGITGIVGPNGCGKTNIVDAIRWVLGEQKSSTLRSDKMENVIFNGTRQRKPMGMAEVSLTLINDQGKLPTDYSEIKITRRIFRSGESEYLLNNNICRLKDITNLFMDTGIAANAYSVIELKMVETILSSKAEERRKLFEEAAGVNKYKLRRRLSLKKLEDVKSDLTRVNDIVSEVEKKVRSLERQAKKADKYNQIQSILREKEIDLAEHEFALFSKKRIDLQNRREILSQRKNEIDSSIRGIENQLIEYRSSISEVEEKLSEKRLNISRVTSKLHDIQKSISVNEERLNSLRNNIERFREEIEDLTEERDENINLIHENESKIVELNAELKEKEEEINSFGNKLEELKAELDIKRNETKQKADDVVNKVTEINSIKNRLQNLQKNRQNLNDRIKRINERIQKITNDIARGVGYLEQLQQERENVSSQLKDAEKSYSEKQEEKENLEKELSVLRQKELEEKGLLQNLQNKIELLANLINNLEGVSSGSKILLESAGWTEKEKTLIADAGSAKEDKYRFALEAALKHVLNNLLLEDINDLKKAVDFLKKNELGKASFFLLKEADKNGGVLQFISNFSKNRRKKKLSKAESFLGWSYEYINTPSKWKPYFNKLLSNIAVVKDIDAAINLMNRFPEFNFVTLNGDLIKSEGVIEAGSLPTADETLFGRKQLLEDLKKEVPQIESNLRKLQDIVEETENKISSIDLKILSERGKVLLNDLNNIDKQISQLDFENKKANEEIEKAQAEIQELATESNLLDNEANEAEELLGELLKEKEILNNEAEEFENKLNRLQNIYSAEVETQNQTKLAFERLNGELRNYENAINRAKRAIEQIEANIQKRKNEITASEQSIGSIENALDDSKYEYDEIYVERNKLEEEEKEIEARLKEIKSKASQLESDVTQIRSERENISDEMHSIDIELNKISIKLENLAAHIKEEYSLDLEVKEFEDLDTYDYNFVADEVQTLKGRLKNLGPINLLAYSEYEEEKERLDFLHGQRDDLIESEKDLINTIKEINETAENIFIETFEAIRINFKKIFRTLFHEEDEADLILEEGVDPLEAKIEISAKPKGKRPTSIELLSGGEKTLTATALLFAIYLVKPSPFCILDEVDAPLDDANIDRFTKLLYEFSNNTQFIIVTHNKRTMEAAENMYGVTIQEEGISKLVGVQFNEQLSDIVPN